MRIIISPAKKMNVDTDSLAWQDLPQFIDCAEYLRACLKQLSYEQLKQLWKCSDAIASLNAERLAHMDLRQAGGKGINISRALVSNGTENLALLVLGQENADGFLRNLDTDGVRYDAITVPGRIRENITIEMIATAIR